MDGGERYERSEETETEGGGRERAEEEEEKKRTKMIRLRWQNIIHNDMSEREGKRRGEEEKGKK